MRLFKTDHGEFPLSAAWWGHADRLMGHAGDTSQVSADNVRRTLQRLSEKRHRSLIEPVLTDEERALMQSSDRVFDLHTCARLLDGRRLDEFGFSTLCQTHFHRWEPAGCGCAIVTVSDHHAPEKPPQGFKSMRSCPQHAQHAAVGSQAHHEALMAHEGATAKGG